MKNSFWHWRTPPILFSILFSLIDFLWIGLIHFSRHLLLSGEIDRNELLWHLYDIPSTTWRSIHFPIQSYLEPVFFPAVVSHPSDITMGAILAFEFSCVFQWTIVGFIIGTAYYFCREFSGFLTRSWKMKK